MTCDDERPAAPPSAQGTAARRPLRPLPMRRGVHDHPSYAELRGRALRRLVILAVVLVAVSVLSPIAVQLSPTKSYAVASGSMEPAIPKGSLVVAKEGPIAVGDVVVYHSPTGEFQVHRVTSIHQEDGRTLYQTAGDANEAQDAFLIPESSIQGKLVRHAPHLGWLWLLPGWVQLVGFCSALLGYLVLTAWEARHLIRARLPWRRAAAVSLLMLAATPALGDVVAGEQRSVLTASKVATPTPLAAGNMGSATVAADGNNAEATAPAPRLWKEITMWNCRKDATCLAPLSPGLSEELGSLIRIDMSQYDPQPTFYFEAVMAAPSGEQAIVQLWDRSSSSVVAGSEVRTTTSELTTVRSEAFSLTGAKDYTIRTQHTGTGQGGEIAHARLVLVQDHPTRTVEQVRLSQGSREASTSWSVPSRAAPWRYDGAAMDGVAGAYFEVVAEVDGDMLTNSAVRLVDRTRNVVVASLTVSIFDTSITRFRSADLRGSLVAGNDHEIEVRRGDGVLSNRLHLYVARMVLLQSDFTTTVRYVDLSWTTETTSNTYTPAGYPGRYHGLTEWGGTTGFFEATLRNTDGGTTSARLVDQGSATIIAGSTVSSTGTTSSRVRSGAVDLVVGDASYGLELSASSGTAKIRQAWLIVWQDQGKTYDHVLATRNDVADLCPWSFRLKVVATMDLERIRGATITLQGETSAQQIRIEEGAVVLAEGTPVTVPYPTRMEHVVVTDPSSPGASSVRGDLWGRCAGTGIHTVQAVTYHLT